MFATAQRIHFIGIGGIGMSGIAEILLGLGYPVSGSDQKRSPITDRLVTLGAQFYEGHQADHVAGAGVVVTSSAISPHNPEVQFANMHRIPVIQRAEMLAELMRLKYGIAIAGMHGKTTTTSMIYAVLYAGNLDPTVIVGGRVNALGSNARHGNSQYLVAEADESDRSFLKLSPILAVVTNLDREHMDCYRDMADVEQAFIGFMDHVPFYGATTACIDNVALRSILPRVTRRVHTYGESEDAEFRVELLKKSPDCHSRFAVHHKGESLGEFTLNVPGKHNVLNATAAIAIGVQLQVPPGVIAEALTGFRGVDRRFQIKGTVRGVTVVDDYGHHPTEIRATLRAARECGYSRVHVLFQPHRYTRTRDLMADFATAFDDADSVAVTDIYAASEDPIPGIDSPTLVAAIRTHAATTSARTDAHYVDGFQAAAERIAAQAKDGDVVLTLGAGNISQAGQIILEALNA
jgi:UDP-N-acetylmuramate--alanine ligase